ADARLLEPADRLPRALSRPLRRPLHDSPLRPATAGDDLRSGRDQGSLSGAARRPAPRRGRQDPRTGRGHALGDPPPRGPPPPAAQVDASRVPREKMQRLSSLMSELTEREIDSWPLDV